MDSHRLGIMLNGKVAFWLKTDANVFIGLESISTYNYNDNKWHHVAGTYSSSSGTATLYVDGYQVSSITNASYGGLSVGNTTKLVIGSDALVGYNNGYFNGAISDVRIWNVTLPSSEIASSYQYRLNGTESGLAGYWKLDQATTILYNGSVAGFKDSTSNANDTTDVIFQKTLTWDTTIGFVPTPT